MSKWSDRHGRVTEILDEIDWDYEEQEEADPYFYVMGLDPGGTTGVAMIRIDTRDDEINPELVYLHQIPGGYDGFKDWFYGSTPSHNMQIVSEKWKERNIKGADRTPQYIEGGILWAWGDHTVWQFPDHKGLVPDEWLKENNLWTENRRHQMDALKHALAYLRNEEHPATLSALSGHGDGEPIAEPGAGDKAQLPQEAEESDEDFDGDESDGDGGEAAKNAAEALSKALAEMGDRADAAAFAMEAMLEALDGDEQGGGPSSGDQTREGGGWSGEVKIKGTRKKRELNGAFTGFDSDGADEVTSVLFED